MIKDRKILFLCVVCVLLTVSISIGSFGWVVDHVIDVSAASGNATVSGFEAQIKDLEKQEAAIKNKIICIGIYTSLRDKAKDNTFLVFHLRNISITTLIKLIKNNPKSIINVKRGNKKFSPDVKVNIVKRQIR